MALETSDGAPSPQPLTLRSPVQKPRSRGFCFSWHNSAGSLAIWSRAFSVIRRLKDEQKLTVLLVEQNAALALEIADHGYVMENGRIVLEGPADQLRQNSDIKEFYLGLNEAGSRKSYRDTKHYRRRKRWLS